MDFQIPDEMADCAEQDWKLEHPEVVADDVVVQLDGVWKSFEEVVLVGPVLAKKYYNQNWRSCWDQKSIERYHESENNIKSIVDCEIEFGRFQCFIELFLKQINFLFPSILPPIFYFADIVAWRHYLQDHI